MVVIGGFLLILAVLIAPSVYTAWRDWQAATAIEAATARPGQTVVAAGRAVAGARGLLTAPLSGRPCVWYQQETRRHLQRPVRSGTERDVRVDSVTTSERSFGVTDDQGRVVMIQPENLRQADLLWAHREERVAEAHERLDQGAPTVRAFGRRAIPYETTAIETLEWIVAPDENVVVGGMLAPDGQVTAPRRGPYVIRTSTRAEIRRRRARVLALTVFGTLATAVLGLALTIAGT